MNNQRRRDKNTHIALRPLHNRLVVERLEEGEQVEGGIIIPDSAKEKPQRGNVIAVGNGTHLKDGTTIALNVKPGEQILFAKYGGSEITIDGHDYLILREDEVLAVIDDAEGLKKVA